MTSPDRANGILRELRQRGWKVYVFADDLVNGWAAQVESPGASVARLETGPTMPDAVEKLWHAARELALPEGVKQ